jgi:hypothetical protein
MGLSSQNYPLCTIIDSDTARVDFTHFKMNSPLTGSIFHYGSDFRQGKKNLSSWSPIARLLNSLHIARQTTKNHLAREDF